MTLEEEITILSEELTLTNLDSTLLRLFQLLKQNLSPQEFSEITDPKKDSERGRKLMLKRYGPVSALIEEIYKTLSISRTMSDRYNAPKEKLDIEKAVILIGGEGTRLRPITYILPKPLIPIHGRTLTEHVMDIVKRYGIQNVVLAVGYGKDLVKKYFNNGLGTEIHLSYTEERKPSGTAGTLYIMDRPAKPFLMINGDNLFDLDIQKMYDFLREKNALAVIALTPVENPSRGGAVNLEGEKIRQFWEKLSGEQARQKIGEPPYWLNSGYYLLSPEIFDNLPKQREITMMEDHVFPALAKTGRLFGFKSRGQWHDSGTIIRYEDVVRNWRGIYS
ncbi:nucleotidyltransferase family protein [Candidatus Woesearchaeota archaeon]|nr:nucleotidyltransferase family protein [Candidatus Woesearchaeota archaeon]